MLDWLSENWDLAQAHPLPFLTLAFTAFVIGILVGRFILERTTQNLRSTIDRQSDELSSWQRATGVSHPAQSKENLENLEDRLALLEGAIEKEKTERGSNVNGEYDRYSNGLQICKGKIMLPERRLGGLFENCQVFPAQFWETPSVSVIPSDAIVIKNVDKVRFEYEVNVKYEGDTVEYSAVGSFK